MPKRSSKRKLNGVKLRRLQLAVTPEVFEKFHKLAGDVSYNVTFELMTEYIAQKAAQKIKKTHFPENYVVIETPNL